MANDEFGDFQTPVPLARIVLETLGDGGWTRILEPTCGQGNFLEAASERFPDADRVGVEIQAEYAAVAHKYGRVTVGDAMRTDFGKAIDWHQQGPLLVVGNPPWVTNAELTRLGSDNKPDLMNLRKLSGLDALTGASNFDIAEAMILKFAADLASDEPTIAMLCKTQVARNAISYFEQFHLPLAEARIYEINAKKWFGALVDACLFVVKIKADSFNYIADVYKTLEDVQPSHQIGAIDGRLVSDVVAYEQTKAADGESPITWRQGVKHDATQVMELVEADGPRTKSGEPVKVEDTHLFPLFKSTDVFRGRTSSVTKWMIVPQRRTSDNTNELRVTAPLLWEYLNANSEALDSRKSSIYRKRARFCIFGVGDYTFAPYKVAVSGMHKLPTFRLIGPINGQPVVFDDVCYFTSFDDLGKAALVSAILTSEPAQKLMNSLIFTDSKRPVTKKLLQRIDVAALSVLTEESQLLAEATEEAKAQGFELSSEDAAHALTGLRSAWAGSDTQPETLFG